MLDRLNRHDLGDAEWQRLRVFLPADPPRGGRWSDHRMVINGSSSAPGRAARGGTCRRASGKTIYNRHRRWSLDGTWEQILDGLRAGCDEAEGAGWTVSDDSTVWTTPGPSARGRARPYPGR